MPKFTPKEDEILLRERSKNPPTPWHKLAIIIQEETGIIRPDPYFRSYRKRYKTITESELQRGNRLYWSIKFVEETGGDMTFEILLSRREIDALAKLAKERKQPLSFYAQELFRKAIWDASK